MEPRNSEEKEFWSEIYQDKEDSQEFYSKWAQSYDGIFENNTLCSFNEHACKKLSALIKGDKGKVEVIDLGCGTGGTAVRLKNQGFNVIDGVDGSDEMLKEAKGKSIYRNLSQKLILGEGSLDDLRENSYDAAIMIGAISKRHVHVRDALREILRLVKPGGVAVYGANDRHRSMNVLQIHADLEKARRFDLVSIERLPYISVVGEIHQCYLFCIEVL